jgi:hypothetical protein
MFGDGMRDSAVGEQDGQEVRKVSALRAFRTATPNPANLLDPKRRARITTLGSLYADLKRRDSAGLTRSGPQPE